MKSEVCHTMPAERQSAHYKPNIWKYDFLQSLTNKYEEEECKSRAEKLKEDVKHSFVETVAVLKKLELIDSIGKLGLSNLFEDEIREALDIIAPMKNENLGVEEDLYATALYFKLLRQRGYEISQDIFSSFLDETGRISTSKCTEIKGVIELLEASHLGLADEQTLVEAKSLSTNILQDMIQHSTLDCDQTEIVLHVLELSAHWRVQWFDVRWHINMYENEREMNKTLLELAKLNFNMVQATLRNDIREISRTLGLIENFNFMRDRLVESFMCAVGLVFQPMHSSFRKWLTKVVVFVLVIDDIYDNYGSLEELQHFTNAVDRWDPKEIQHLPKCMKLGFQALYDTTNQMANEIEKEKGWKGVLPNLKKGWADFCNALFVESKWSNMGYTPTLREYLSNAWISSSGTVLAVHSFFSIMDEATEEMAHFLNKSQDLVYNSSLIIRLCNDLGTSTAELERGDVASSILCHMQEVNVSEEMARNHIKAMISETWTKINGQCFNQPPLLQPFVNITTNFARVAHSLYQYGDGFGVQDRDTKKTILSLLVEPISM